MKRKKSHTLTPEQIREREETARIIREAMQKNYGTKREPGSTQS